MSKFFDHIEDVPEAELFGHMVRIGLALVSTKGTIDPQREQAIRMYDECVTELNRRGMAIRSHKVSEDNHEKDI